jgi:SagB-type dehydrogenase family enzyme
MRTTNLTAFLVAAFLLTAGISAAGDIQLPKPRQQGGKPLMQALKERKTTRDFDSKALSKQTLADLLWATFGINRPEKGMRTAPSAMNWQEVDVYVVMKEGAYRYDAAKNLLVQVVGRDIRERTGHQTFVKDVPVNLVFVADWSKLPDKASDEDKLRYTSLDTGYISQNVYLFCASEGLASVARGLVDRQGLAKILKLRPRQKIVLTQSVGFPKKP